VSWVGVDCFHSEYIVGRDTDWEHWRGEPTYYDSRRGGVVRHGTGVAGIINAGTNNGVGTAGLVPTALVLPFAVQKTDATHLDKSAVKKAFRALRFQFAHGSWTEMVRVVNMSFGGNDSDLGGFEISADLDLYDRLYVGSAGNDAVNEKTYPGAYSFTLGVSGLWTNENGSVWRASEDADGTGGGSSYYNDNYSTYPVSGIYHFFDRVSDPMRSYHMSLAPPGQGMISENTFQHPGIQGVYHHFSGTSACAPAVSGLAVLLYDAHPDYNYTQIRQRIVETRLTYLDQHGARQIAGPLSYSNALSGW